MGNGHSGGPRMAIAAMADMMPLTKPQLVELRNACLRHAKPNRDKSQDTGPTISRQDLISAMKEVRIDTNDADVLDQLFTMWDKTGSGRVIMFIFLSSISPLASTLDVETQLLFAFQMFDFQNTGRVRRDDAVKILGGINATASYFGDVVVTPQAVEIVIEDIFRDQTDFFYAEYVDLIASHPAVTQFVTANGTIRYGA
mmetsp:Transcript_15262/g.18577  ORF Transcript_15262/g.18577 Transcript_15262/m.18577 type:complete len:199 (-) Transcript_15262:93-689(-)